jgi:hypothetical protein
MHALKSILKITPMALYAVCMGTVGCYKLILVDNNRMSISVVDNLTVSGPPVTINVCTGYHNSLDKWDQGSDSTLLK